MQGIIYILLFIFFPMFSGFTEEVIPLLQQYINFTSDIQTPCLLCLRALPRELLEHDVISYWISWLVIM